MRLPLENKLECWLRAIFNRAEHSQLAGGLKRPPNLGAFCIRAADTENTTRVKGAKKDTEGLARMHGWSSVSVFRLRLEFQLSLSLCHSHMESAGRPRRGEKQLD